MPDLPSLREGMMCRREIVSTLSIDTVPLTIVCHTLSDVWHKGITKERFASYAADGYLDGIPMSQYKTQTTDHVELSDADWARLVAWVKEEA